LAVPRGLPPPPKPLRVLAHGHRVSSERRHFCRLSLNERLMAGSRNAGGHARIKGLKLKKVTPLLAWFY